MLAVGTAASAVAVTVWLFVRYPGALVSNVANPDPGGHVDFDTFWRSSVALLQGADVYRTGALLPNLNPPLLASLLAPLGLMPAPAAYLVFTVASLCAMTAAVLLAARELRLPAGWTALAVGTLWASSPLHGTLVLGQIYGLLMLGLTIGWVAGRRGHPLIGAAVLGVVVAVKPSLAPVLLIPLVQRRWSPLVVGIGSSAAATLVGVLVAGPSSALTWITLARGTPAPEVDANASLPGLVARLGGPGLLGWTLTVLVVAASLWWVRGPVPARGRTAAGAAVARRTMTRDAADPRWAGRGTVGPEDAALFAVTAGCLLASPIAWLNYTVLLWPGAMVLLAAGRWRVGLPLLVLPVIPIAWANLWQIDPTATASLAGRSLYCLVLVGYWVALLALSRAPRAAEPDRAPETVAAGHR